jgi:hypothetical protein
LSRMTRKRHVRFSGGGRPERASRYPTLLGGRSAGGALLGVEWDASLVMHLLTRLEHCGRPLADKLQASAWKTMAKRGVGDIEELAARIAAAPSGSLQVTDRKGRGLR